MRYSYALIMGALVFFLIYKLLRFDALGYSFNDMYALYRCHVVGWMDGHSCMITFGVIITVSIIIIQYCYGGALLYAWCQGALYCANGLVTTGLLDHKPLSGPLAGVCLEPGDITDRCIAWPHFILAQRSPKHWLAHRTNIPACGSSFWRGTRRLLVKKTNEKEFWAILAGAFLALVKEDGAVLALLIHGSAVAMRFLSRLIKSVCQPHCW